MILIFLFKETFNSTESSFINNDEIWQPRMREVRFTEQIKSRGVFKLSFLIFGPHFLDNDAKIKHYVNSMRQKYILLYGKLVHDEKEHSGWFPEWTEFCNTDHYDGPLAEFL